MWKRHLSPTARYQASTDELAVAITDEAISVVALMAVPLEAIVIDTPTEGTTSIIFLTPTNQAVSVTIQGGIEVLESAFATASFAYRMDKEELNG